MRDEYRDDGIPFLRSQNVQPFRVDTRDVKFVSEAFHRKLKKSALTAGDVVVVRTGYPGTAALVPDTLPVANCADLVVITPGPTLDGRFLVAVFNSAWGKSTVSGGLVGVAQQHFNVTVAKEMRIPHPPIDEQRKAASVLAAYDELIENNLRRIDILEEMAQAVYREWFVNFRFPGHEDVELVDSPLGLIPEGWEVLVLEHVVSTLESGSRPRGGIDPNETGIPSVGAENVLGLGKYDYSKDKYISRSFFESMRRGHVRSGDVLLYKDGAKLGRKSLFRDGFPHPECAINEHVFLLRTNGRVSQTFLYLWLDLPVNTQRIIDLNSNAAQPGISQPKVLGLPILAPPVELLKQFDAVTEPLLALLFNLARQNRNLAMTRDLLLPRLVSGEIDVSEMEIDTEWLAS